MLFEKPCLGLVYVPALLDENPVALRLEDEFFLLHFCKERMTVGFEAGLLEGCFIIGTESNRTVVMWPISRIMTNRLYYQDKAVVVQVVEHRLDGGFDLDRAQETEAAPYQVDVCCLVKRILLVEVLDGPEHEVIFVQPHVVNEVVKTALAAVQDDEPGVLVRVLLHGRDIPAVTTHELDDKFLLAPPHTAVLDLSQDLDQLSLFRCRHTFADDDGLDDTDACAVILVVTLAQIVFVIRVATLY